ncbi:glycosyltransferase family 4 protein [Methylotuvimicrobium buryatense]|uniref:Glycosyltransferase family 4 protein n=1 Tax=Methylotuvimicrobium buryatense TaxID=95641 RepID=A0A4P9ULJ6_METBY|nr:glycosyltransferase family 4 protein [Methylotuvimicrobium buryatense]QCW81987.1 glycosyltransferase family 4 protein [Methylotuvimicrobium buryatense]
MKTKNLLIITELFLPTKGGSAVWFDEVYRRLGGKNIHILTADVQGSREYDANHPNTVHRVNLQRVWWLKPESLGMYAKLFFKAVHICLFNKVDAIHAGRVLPEGLVAWLIGKLFRRPVVIYAHGEEITTWRQPAKFKVMRFAYKHADKVIANSDFTKNELLKLGVDEAIIKPISPGVDIERFRPGLPFDDLHKTINLNKGQKLILSVGRLSRRKGFDHVIKALPFLLDAGLDVQYALIGIGEDRDYLIDLAKNNNVLDRVHLLGHVEMDDLPRWYNACDVFVMPNREIQGDTEGFGMVFLEAAACGKPAICGNAGGTGSAIIDRVTGLRVEGESIETIKQALQELLSDANLTGQLAINAKERARQYYSWEYVARLTSKQVL